MSAILGETCYGYSNEEAIEDGFITDVSKMLPECPSGIYATHSLLNQKGYEVNDVINRVALGELILQVSLKLRHFVEDFNVVSVEFPNGSRDNIYVCSNGNGYTLMLPEDY